jgi:ABC-type branched-subunit amino acid transport system ATPase component/ABC-type branched-subunit amino acid transport system permease subunit
MLATWVTPQLVADGTVNGLVIGLIAMGLVLIYRSTRIINFAVGSLGVVSASLLALLVRNYAVPFWLALVASLGAGAALGAIVELAVVRRLFDASRVTLMVATIGVSQLLLALVVSLPAVKGLTAARYPLLVDGRRQIGSVTLSGAQLSILVVVPVVAGALSLLLNHTRVGGAVTAAADNARLARTHGINPKLVSTFVWTVAGVLSAVSMILIAGLSGRAPNIAALGPNTMVRALAAMVLGGMVSFRGSLVAGVAIGVGQSLIRFNVDRIGAVELVLFAAILVAVAIRARHDQTTGSVLPLSRALRPIPERAKQIWWVRWLPGAGYVLAGIAAAALPLVVDKPSRLLLYGTVIAFAICVLSVMLLTGWGGQLSLGQMAFAGLGALAAAAIVRIGLPFAVAIPLAAAATALLAAVVGAGALRVNEMYLAIVTFAMGVAATQFLYRTSALSNDNASTVPFRRGAIFGLPLDSQRTYYYVLLVTLVLFVVAFVRLRSSGVGRSIIAVRDNPRRAAAMTVSPMRMRVLAFALSGGIAGFGGAVLAGAIQTVPLTKRFFQVDNSLELVAMAVIGGLGTAVGALLGPLWVVGLPAFFPDNELVPLLASGGGLLVLLLYFPGGLAQLVYAGRDVVVRAGERRLPPATGRSAAPSTWTPARRAGVPADVPALSAEHITVRFGGKVAVDDASIVVAPGTIVGLIGTNGAGKSTLLNAIGGFVRADGVVRLAGVDVSHRSAASRASAGLGRSFQAAQLFPDLTVRETVQVALEGRGRAGVATTTLGLPRSTRAERAKRAEAGEIIDLLGLGRFADHQVGALSTGTRRIAELACLLALGSSVLCLDEPTAGVAQREAEAMAPLLQSIRSQLDAAMVVIEHDMPFITSISDHIYCLEAGRVIADGTPAAVRDDPLVIASYLGTDVRAIERSGPSLGRRAGNDQPGATRAR